MSPHSATDWLLEGPGVCTAPTAGVRRGDPVGGAAFSPGLRDPTPLVSAQRCPLPVVCFLKITGSPSSMDGTPFVYLALLWH